MSAARDLSGGGTAAAGRAEEAAAAIRLMRRQGVGLAQAVRVLLAARGYQMADLMRMARCPRWQLYEALAGRMEPPLRLRAALRGILGVDPWRVAQAAEAEALAQEGEGP